MAVSPLPFRMYEQKGAKTMVKIEKRENSYVVTLNGVAYTSCDTIEDARREAKSLRRSVRYGI